MDAPPLTPDEETARRWAEDELSNPIYDIAEPTLFDRVAQSVGEFIGNLFSPQLPGEFGPIAAVVAAIVVIVLIAGAFAIWGVPRAIRRGRGNPPVLFGESDARSAAQLRRDAESKAAATEWDQAIVLRFRAIAQGCIERGVVNTPPGATVHAFARAASPVFPASADALEFAATTFDDVRYLRRRGNAELYRQIVATDDAVAAARPAIAEEALA
ncbi:DUF4129 domain-containing protein [Microbacterium sp. NPDC076911]|uniref:DUF4129 domain-containing protein n=1 Tax=Microbacterium sp. NPDC076911 TaxID=3154958 RepID=UPI00341D71A8